MLRVSWRPSQAVAGTCISRRIGDLRPVGHLPDDGNRRDDNNNRHHGEQKLDQPHRWMRASLMDARMRVVHRQMLGATLVGPALPHRHPVMGTQQSVLLQCPAKNCYQLLIQVAWHPEPRFAPVATAYRIAN
jgi:hypothetical protein